MFLHHHRNKFIRKQPRHTQHCFLHHSAMFRMVWRPTVAGVFTHMRFGVLPDFGKICQLRAHLWASKLTEFLDICNTIFFCSLCPHYGPYVFLAYSLQASRDIIPFLIWLDILPSAFSFRIPSVDTFFSLSRSFIIRLRTCALSLFFRASKPYSASPHVLLHL